MANPRTSDDEHEELALADENWLALSAFLLSGFASHFALKVINLAILSRWQVALEISDADMLY